MSSGEDDYLDGAVAPAENPNLFGHDAAQTFLSRAYRSGKSHHAILIEGPEGIGKATLAFRFANHVLSNPDPSQAPEIMAAPDKATLAYRQIVAGSSHNLLHLKRPIDDKTGRQKTAITVEEVRKAGKFFAQTAGSDNWRIVIVDTADDLNRNAANAILKILEEPPRRAMFLVLSHSPGKLLPTIRSRCLPLALRPLNDADMQAALNSLGFELAPESREQLLAHANGSVAEALKLVNYGGLEILTAFENLLPLRGGGQRREMIKLSEALAAKGADTIFGFFISSLFRRIGEEARNAALAGELAGAERLARLSSELRQRVDTALAYNLDRKQTILEAVEAYLAAS
jgi:DNA polymerase III subunit delta'